MNPRDPKPKPDGLDRETRARALASDLRDCEAVTEVSDPYNGMVVLTFKNFSLPPSVLRVLARHDARVHPHSRSELAAFVPRE